MWEAELKAVDEPHERVIVAMKKAKATNGLLHISGDLVPILRRACPEVAWRTDSNNLDLCLDVDWDSRDFARWFADRARAAGLPTVSLRMTEQTQGAFGRARLKETIYRGWSLRHGSTNRNTKDYNDQSEAFFDAQIAEDGSLVPDNGISAKGLLIMGELLHLTTATTPPRDPSQGMVSFNELFRKKL